VQPIGRHAREGGHPGLYRGMALKSLDLRVRGDDGVEGSPRYPPVVIPAKAGIQGFIAAWR